MLTRRTLSLSLVISLALLQGLPPAVVAQNSDEDMLTRIRKEGMEHSQILKTMHMLTDVYGNASDYVFSQDSSAIRSAHRLPPGGTDLTGSAT